MNAQTLNDRQSGSSPGVPSAVLPVYSMCSEILTMSCSEVESYNGPGPGDRSKVKDQDPNKAAFRFIDRFMAKVLVMPAKSRRADTEAR
jgi:hypothetical protein